ncbi:hypothetical protein IFR04_009954 [Cadophora malorum]|uniref:Subtelomeric hrmA-associated cluster protein AFUB-079030/YDR124W-like helical bundle domain-containing protein n=1 Tax=Cadophora malorum TaxID=108018 RepID=A0A8H7W412_9HELO|nr:hypothetical protein IFR04_009954 [Cadophora malorum]
MPQEPRLPNIPPAQHRQEPALPATIDSLLREHAAISGLKRWALIVQTDQPELRTYSSKSLAPYRDQFFTEQFKDAFMNSAYKAEARDGYQGSSYQDAGMYSEFESDSKYDARKQSSGSEMSRRHHRKSRSEESDGDGSVSAKRRRKGYGGQYREKSNEEMPVAQATTRHDMEIGNEAQVTEYYRVRFSNMQQSACKVMGKAFVKLVEPKKQTHHPYTKGDEKAPPWWPNTKGENCVRHKEPDHLLKPERIRLLVHILNMIVEPAAQQHLTVQRLGLNVKKLESATMEVMSPWFADKEHPENELKRPFLKEIFKVARVQERYKNGEIDGTTIVPVRYGENIGLDDDSEGDGESYKYEQDDDAAHSSAHMPTPPESLVSPSMAQHQQFQQPDDHNMRIRAGLPMRYNAGPMDQMSYEDQTFRGMNQYQPHSPNTIDPSRRNFIPPPVFPSPQQGMFSSGWSNPVTSAPSSQYYTASPQSSLAPFLTLPQPQPQTTHMSQPVHSFSDGLTRYDTSPAMGSQVRTGSLGHPHQQMPNHAAFQDYLNSDSTQFGQHPEMKDEHQQHHLHQQN